MARGGSNPSREVFRPRLFFGTALAVAAVFWSLVLVYLFSFEDVALQTWLSAVFFVAFFGVSATYYIRTAIFIDDGGLTYRGVVRTRRFRFEEIRDVDVLNGLVVVYAVRARGQLFHFTSFFKRHQELRALVVRRAGLLVRDGSQWTGTRA